MDTALSFNLIQDILNNSTLFTHNQIRIENDYRRSKKHKAGAQGFAGAMIAQGLFGGVVNTVKAYKELKDHDKAFMDGNTLYTYDLKEND